MIEKYKCLCTTCLRKRVPHMATLNSSQVVWLTAKSDDFLRQLAGPNGATLWKICCIKYKLGK